MNRTALRIAMTARAFVLAAAVGCASAGSSDGSSQPPITPGTTCAPVNLTRQCSCAANMFGRQTCQANGWSGCACRPGAGARAGSSAGAAGGGAPLAGDPPANRSSVRFDWQRTTPSGGSCEAGHYEGTFSGIYGPSIIVVPNLMVIPVFPIDLPGSPGLAFDLEREGNGEIFKVNNGKMNGNALGAFPFTADIVGSLDCDTRKFDARLINGSYFIGPLEYRFEGPITADYDKLTHTLVNGLWKVDEPDYPGAGGSGDWTVSWKHP